MSKKKLVDANLLHRCLGGLLKPVMAFCVRHSLRVQDVLESVKVAMLDAAQDELEKTGKKVNISRLAVMTGIHKRDVMRIYRDNNAREEPTGLITQVIGQWSRDPRYTTQACKPRILSYKGDDSEFHQLVKEISNDLKPATILFELERVSAVAKTPRGVALKAVGYVPKGDLERGVSILANDSADLINAVEENLLADIETPNLHARTVYDNIRADKVEEIRKWLLEEGTKFHQRAGKYLSQYDLDIVPKKNTKGGAQVVISAFSHTHCNNDNKG